MQFTDIFIKKPVLSVVVSLLILFVGLRALSDLPIRQFPKLDNAVINITTAYPGASAKLVQAFVTNLLQQSVASADGIDYLTSTSRQGMSQISAYIRLGFDTNDAFTEIMSKVSEVRNQLPPASEVPVIEKTTGSSNAALMYITFSSDKMRPEQISDFLMRSVQPQLESLPGVAKAQILGATPFAMRIHLDARKMAAYHLSPEQVDHQIRANHFLSTPGKVKGDYIDMDISAATDVNTPQAFGQLVIAKKDNQLIRLKDIGTVALGPENESTHVVFNGKRATFFGISPTPQANPLTVIDTVKKQMPLIQQQLPPTLTANIAYDATQYIKASLHEVIKTIVEASLIVVFIIFLFLGSMRAVVIPIVTIPLSLIGTCALLLALGYSINLMTLLAMVLAIGLVVDDAIVVLENIQRNYEQGGNAYQAALQGAREIALPIVSMTITLAAVYAPMSFLGGVTGSLFKEFAFTLASSVIISGIISLTLSPMMCHRFLPAQGAAQPTRFAQRVSDYSNRLQNAYGRWLTHTLAYRKISLWTLITLAGLSVYLYTQTPKELAPQEDQSVVFMASQGPEYANINYMKQFTPALDAIASSTPEVQHYFSVNGTGSENQGFSGFILKPWEQRSRSQATLIPLLQKRLNQIPGLQISAFGLPPLPTSGKDLPIQFVLKSTDSHEHLLSGVNQLLEAARKANRFIFIDSDLRLSRPQLDIHFDREQSALLGINMQNIGQSLSAGLSEHYINRFSMKDKSYKVIPVLEHRMRNTPENIGEMYLQTDTHQRIPLKNIAQFSYSVQPNQLNQFQQLNAITLSGFMQPGQTMADGLNFLKSKAQELLPRNTQVDYAGQSRQYIQEGHALVLTFFFALIVIFLVLSAQFESFRSPWIILSSIPLSACGALIPMNLGLSTINIYSQVGLITLIGLISKHGILIVEFANKLREKEGYSIHDAIKTSSMTRLRPILMTTAAAVMGIMPLLFSKGAGAESRFSMSLVIFSGMLLGTLCTLFIIPSIYTYIAKESPTTA